MSSQEDEKRALRAWHVCPRCGADLRPVAGVPYTWGCYGAGQHTPETFYLPEEEEHS
jgi:hypothetical protein